MLLHGIMEVAFWGDHVFINTLNEVKVFVARLRERGFLIVRELPLAKEKMLNRLVEYQLE